VLGRDQELEQISEVLQQIIDDEQPVNAFIYGISGTGKTVSIKYKERELSQALQRYDDVHATFIYQNCESLSSSYQAAISIANSYLEDPEYEYLHDELGFDRNRLPSSGLPKEHVYDILFEIFDLLTYRHTTYRAELEDALEDADLNVDVTAADLASTDSDADLEDSQRADILGSLHAEYDTQPPEEVTDYVTVIYQRVDPDHTFRYKILAIGTDLGADAGLRAQS